MALLTAARADRVSCWAAASWMLRQAAEVALRASGDFSSGQVGFGTGRGVGLWATRVQRRLRARCPRCALVVGGVGLEVPERYLQRAGQIDSLFEVHPTLFQ